MEKIKINNTEVTFDFSNQVVIARVPESFQDDETTLLDLSDIVAVASQRLDVNGLDIELLAIDQDNNVILYSVFNGPKYRSFTKAMSGFGYHQVPDYQDPKLIMEKMREAHKQSLSGKCFNEVTVEPSADAHICDILKEMKSLSRIIGMPVCAKINGKDLRITSTTDIYRAEALCISR